MELILLLGENITPFELDNVEVGELTCLLKQLHLSLEDILCVSIVQFDLLHALYLLCYFVDGLVNGVVPFRNEPGDLELFVQLFIPFHVNRLEHLVSIYQIIFYNSSDNYLITISIIYYLSLSILID